MRTENILDIWGKGQLLAYSGITGFTDPINNLVLRTGEKTEFYLKFPVDKGIIRIADTAPKTLFLASDCFKITVQSSLSPLDTDSIIGALPDTYHLLISCNINANLQLIDIPDDYEILQRQDAQQKLVLIGVKRYFRPELINIDLNDLIPKYQHYFSNLPDFGIKSDLKIKTLAKAYAQIKSQIYSPYEDFTGHWSTPDRWPHRNMWLWDSAFHAIGMRHINPTLALELITAVLDRQIPATGNNPLNGMIPHMSYPGYHTEITQPPILAFGLKMVLTHFSSDQSVQPHFIDTLRKYYPRLQQYLQWNMQNRDTDGVGLVEWLIEGDPRCRSGESGMDNSSRFDAAAQLDAPDFNAYLSLECECMAEFAGLLGFAADADYWQSQHLRLNSLMNELLWSDSVGIYMDRDVKTGELTGIASSAGFLPLICGAPDVTQVSKLVSQLRNPRQFGTTQLVPSISRANPEAYSKDMWRGPVWININYLIALGLERCGEAELAAEIINSTLNLEEQNYQKFGTFFEFYDDENKIDPPGLLRKCDSPSDNPWHQPFHDYGWSATLYIDMLWKSQSHHVFRPCKPLTK